MGILRRKLYQDQFHFFQEGLLFELNRRRNKLNNIGGKLREGEISFFYSEKNKIYFQTI